MGRKGSATTKLVLAILFLIIVGLGISSEFENNLNDVNLPNQEISDVVVTENEETSNPENIGAGDSSKGDDKLERSFSLESVPEYKGDPYAIINDNVPYFEKEEMTTNSYEMFSELDELGRCGVVHASIAKDLMPTEEREYIGYVKPTGWQASRYEGVDGGYLYNRCHLIGFQLTGENANEKNLITDIVK